MIMFTLLHFSTSLFTSLKKVFFQNPHSAVFIYIFLWFIRITEDTGKFYSYKSFIYRYLNTSYKSTVEIQYKADKDLLWACLV